MNRNLLWFFGGMVLGGAIGSFVTYKALEKRYERTLDKEIEESRRRYLEARRSLSKPSEEKGGKDTSEAVEAVREPLKGLNVHFLGGERIPEEEIEESETLDGNSWEFRKKKIQAIRAATDYSGIPQKEREDYMKVQVDGLGTEEEIEEALAEMEYPEDDEPEPQDEPFVITLEEFTDERREYFKETVTYYEPDNVFTDERDELMTDVTDCFGTEIFEWFEQHPDEEVCFVRNDKLCIDYEILRVQCSWLEGEFYEDKPRDPMKRRRAKVNWEEDDD